MNQPNVVDAAIGKPRWTVDLSSLTVRHVSGFTVQHRFRRDFTCACHVIAGGPNLEGLAEAEHKVRLAWLKQMLRESSECLFEALSKNLH